MQSFIRRAWCQDPNDKKPEKALLPKPKMRPSSVVEIPPLFRMKRKRSNSPGFAPSSEEEVVKRRKTSETVQSVQLLPEHQYFDAQTKEERNAEGDGSQPYPLVPTDDAQIPKSISTSHPVPTTGTHSDQPHIETKATFASHEDTSVPKARSKSPAIENTRQSELSQIFEHQFNLEILLKHRELRLIEQELAKCQIALEQLRRCELVPYPGSTGLDESISSGSGPALKAQPGFTQPQAPTPWGVENGPYTRHYSRWLLNDPTFDSMPIQQMQPTGDYFSAAPEGRSTRNSGAGLSRAGKGRPSRDSVGNFSHALPNYPMQARGKGGPLVIKRLADNRFVKLICNNCQRGDFSSVQGFLNHCRIAHKVDYKSHEAAATDCGQPLEDDEMHLIPQATPAPVAATRTPGPKVTAPAPQAAPTGFVHPFNAPVMPRYTWKVQAAAARATEAANASQTPQQLSSVNRQPRNAPVSSAAARSFHSGPLIGSSTTPYLSTQFAKRGLGGNLQHATSRACEKVDIGPDPADEDDSSASGCRKPSVSKGNPTVSGMRFSLPDGVASVGRPQSRKGQHTSMSRPRPAPLAPQSAHFANMHCGDVEIPESPQDSNHSPHTADSNPGLVSDHEDDDAASDLDEARSERHSSPDAPMTQLGGMRSGIGVCGGNAMDVDVEVDDDGDGHHGVLIRPRGLAFQEFAQRAADGSSQRPVSRFGEAAK